MFELRNVHTRPKDYFADGSINLRSVIVDDSSHSGCEDSISSEELNNLDEKACVFQKHGSLCPDISNIFYRGYFFERVEPCDVLINNGLKDIDVVCTTFVAKDCTALSDISSLKMVFRKAAYSKGMFLKIQVGKDEEWRVPVLAENQKDYQFCVHRSISWLKYGLYIFLCLMTCGICLFVPSCREALFYREENVLFSYNVFAACLVPNQKGLTISLMKKNDKGHFDYLLSRVALPSLHAGVRTETQ